MKIEASTVKNPLTVISIFAALAEVAGTIVLPFVANANQLTYIWFLMLIPVLLVVLFFTTLNFNPRVLYAPSDFEDEKNYMDLFRLSSTVERLEKLEDEISQDELNQKQTDTIDEQTEVISTKDRLIDLMQRDLRSRYIMAENLIIDRLATEYGQPPQRDIALKSRNGNQLFDAVFEEGSELLLVEIKVFSERTNTKRMRVILEKIQSSFSSLPNDVRKNARFLLAIAYEMEEEKAKKTEKELKSMLMEFPMKSKIRMFSLNSLIEDISKK